MHGINSNGIVYGPQCLKPGWSSQHSLCVEFYNSFEIDDFLDNKVHASPTFLCSLRYYQFRDENNKVVRVQGERVGT